MSILDNFPKNLEPRSIQKDILEKIEQNLSSGYKKIIISAPTGVGKSPIAVNLAKHFKSSFVVTATKHLQDQYTREFSILKPVKGKSNFPCLKIMEKEDIKKTDFIKAMKLKMTCDKGECIEKKDGKTSNCKFKPNIQDFAENPIDDTMCPYYNQKYDALTSPHSLWNYPAYFQIMKYNQKAYGEYLGRAISIFDEAHKIEDQILQFIGINIHKKNVEECGITIKSYDLSNIELIIQLLDDMAEYYARQERDLRENRSFQENPNYEYLKNLERNYDRFSKARIEIVSDKENFIINDPINDGGKFKSISIVPLDISKYVQEFFKTDYQIFMSATIDKDSFCETMGINKSEIEIVDTPYSPFDIKNRQIDFQNIARLGRRASEEDELKVIKQIDKIMSDHSNERGLVLTSSIGRCNDILTNVSSKNKKRLKICHAQNPGGKTQDDVLKEHAQDKNSVLLSSSLWDGIDLKDDLSRFQIIAKIPYLVLTEKRVVKKREKYPLWYDSQTLIKLLQGFGRSIRNENDWAKTYVLDTAVNFLLSKTKKMVPKAYYDVFGWN